jgi:hypothetical protein
MYPMMLRYRSALALSAILVALATPTHAHGQLGGLVKKKLGDKIAEKTVDKVLPTQQGSQGAQAVRPPQFGDVILEVSEERFEGFLRGLEAERQAVRDYAAASAAAGQQEAAYRAAESKYDRERAEYERLARAHNQCQLEKAQAPMQAAMSNPATAKMMQRMMTMSDAERDRFEKRAERLAAMGQAAERRNDNAAKLALMDSLDVLYREEFGISFREISSPALAAQPMVNPLEACGPAPVAPHRPEYAGARAESESDFIASRAAAASGLSAQQFGVMRERLQMWWGGARSGFSQAELTLFESRRGDLKKYERHFTHGTPSEWLR